MTRLKDTVEYKIVMEYFKIKAEKLFEEGTEEK